MSRPKLDPKTGICSRCKKSVYNREIKVTHMHHTTYVDYDKDPLANTIEVCAGCHRTIHAEINKLKNPIKTNRYVNLEIEESTLEKALKKAEQEGRSRKRTLELIIEEKFRE